MGIWIFAGRGLAVDITTILEGVADPTGWTGSPDKYGIEALVSIVLRSRS